MSLGREIEEAQRVYKDILNGYSVILLKNETFYVKHLSDLDHGSIQEYKKSCFKEAAGKGVLTEAQQLETLIEQELWSREKEDRIRILKDELSNLNTTRRKLVLKKQIAHIDKEIKGYTKEIGELLDEKDELMGITCETYSEKKLNERYVYYCLFKDKKLKERLFSEEDFEDLDDAELGQLIRNNNEKLSELSSDNINRIAACPFFLNSLMLCDDNPLVYYGKPVIELTNFQQMLFSTGKRYKSTIERSGQVPPDTTSLTQMVSWYENTSASSSGSSSGGSEDGAAGQTIFGADKEELKNLTRDKSDNRVVKDLDKSADKILKEGGKDKTYLDMNDMLKLHGEI